MYVFVTQSLPKVQIRTKKYKFLIMVLLSKFRMFQTKVKQKLMIGLMAPVPSYYNPSCDSNTLTATRSNSREILNIKSSLMASFSRISADFPWNRSW